MTVTDAAIPAADRRLLHAVRGSNVRGLIVLIVALLSIPVGIIALGSGTGLVPLPYEMFLLTERVPIVFHAHMISGAVVLLFAPLTMALRRQPRVHRMLGRLVGAFVVVSGLTAFPVAILSDSAVSARAGFFVQGLVWLALFAHGIAAIRRRDAATHARAMIAMYAVTTGAVWFRMITGAAIALQLPFAPIYAAAAWLGWLIPLTLVLMWQRPSPRTA